MFTFVRSINPPTTKINLKILLYVFFSVQNCFEFSKPTLKDLKTSNQSETFDCSLLLSSIGESESNFASLSSDSGVQACGKMSEGSESCDLSVKSPKIDNIDLNKSCDENFVKNISPSTGLTRKNSVRDRAKALESICKRKEEERTSPRTKGLFNYFKL